MGKKSCIQRVCFSFFLHFLAKSCFMRYFEFEEFEIFWLKNGKFAKKCEQIKKFQNVRKRFPVKKKLVYFSRKKNDLEKSFHF